MAKEKIPHVKILTPVFRLAYPALFQAKKVNENDPKEKAKFSIVMLFRTGETPDSKTKGEKVADLTSMKQEVAKLLLKHIGADWQKNILERKSDGSLMYKTPFKDGAAAEHKTADGKWKPGKGPGVVCVRASSEFKPFVCDAQKTEIVNPQEVYGGCYARAQVTPHWYDVTGNKGVSFWLDAVQFSHDGEPFGGRGSAEDAFDAISLPGGPEAVGAAGASTGDPLAGL